MNTLTNHLCVKESTIQGAGLGLFASTPIQKGQFLSEYNGEILNQKQVDKIKDKIHLCYVIECEPDYYIDAYKNKGCYARYANTLVTQENFASHHFNAIFQWENECCYLEALEDIKEGSEIFVYYGCDDM